MHKILNILQIKKNELKPSAILFFHSFFLVSVIITSKTARDAFFLSRYDKSLLPFMYILTALIMWKGVGFIQRMLKGNSLLQQNIILHSSFALGTILFAFFNKGIFVPILYLWVEIVTALMGMKFWELATNVFNSRQGKRLFGIITAGGSLSGVITGMSIPKLISYGSDALILFTSLVILFCMLLIYALKQYFKYAPKGFKREVDLPRFQFSKMEPFIRHILFIVILLASLSTFVDYQFKIEIGNQFSTELQIMTFFGKFYMITGIISILIQLFLSGRILSYFGVSAGIGSYPFFTLVGAITFIFFSPFIVLSLIKGVDQVIKPTMLGTSIELIWLPISPKKKKFTKPFFNTTIKSIVQALTAFLIIGLSAMNFGSSSVYVLIIGFSFMFMLLVLKTRSFYYDAVANAIESRQLDSGELNFDFSLPGIQDTIRTQLESSDKFTLLFVLDSIKNEKIDPWLESINALKSFNDEDVRSTLITHFGHDDKLFSTEDLHEISESGEKYASVSIQFLKVRTDIDGVRFSNLVDSLNEGVQLSALCHLYEQQKTSIELTEIQNRILKANFPQDILQYVDEVSIFTVDFLNKLFHLEKTQIRLICMKKVDISIYPHLVELVFKSINDSQFKMEIINELIKINLQQLIPLIEEYVNKNIDNEERLRGIPQLLVTIENEKVKPIIEKLIRIGSGELLIEISNTITDSKQEYSFFVNKDIVIKKSREIAGVIFQNIAFIYEDTFIAKDDFILDYFKFKEFEEVECLFRFACILLKNEPIDSYVHSIKNKDTQVPFIVEIVEHKLPESISSVLVPIIEIESNVEKFDIGNKFYKLNTELHNQCKDLYDSNDDWLQAIISYLIVKEGHRSINSDNINWENLSPNLVADDVIDMRRIEGTEISGKIKDYIKLREDETMFTMLEKITTLKKIDLFSNIPNKILYHVSQITEEVEYLEGESIFSEGDFGDHMLVIAKGNVRIHKGEKTIIEMGNGACFGDMAILDGEPRSADATATEDCILFKINQRDFSQVLSTQNEVMIGIVKILTKRLRETTQKLYAN
ncbi:MAG: cyclic nucleotide-binding domain-containing protein [Candidatus Marinimicrobia bacterium]|nr:cyclic nucleotide-binding domain-containing protein [Candidatus Neomarinimicrobiota bacterium]